MERIRIGIICPSEIALRRFMPALAKMGDIFSFSGIAIANEDEWDGELSENIKESEYKKAQAFVDEYQGKIFNSYLKLLQDQDIDAIYIPLPPSLHYQWAKKALEYRKHVIVEKPSTIKVEDTKELIEIAKQNELALHENYMFIYHRQIEMIQKMIKEKEVGEVRLIRTDFGFPKRAANDFRYNKLLGGGALFDCGGYPVKLLSLLMGDIHVDSAKLIYNEQKIDLYGSAQVSNEHQVAQLSFGMDNEYRCCLEVWGSQGVIRTNRIFSAPDQFKCHIDVQKNNEVNTIEVDADDTFQKSLKTFYECVQNIEKRYKTYDELVKQIKLVEDIWKYNLEN